MTIPTSPAEEVHMIPIGEIVEAKANSRVHTEDQIAVIAASMQQFGWTIPCLIDEDGVLIAGHARLRAAKTLGIEEVPCMIAAGWTDAQKEAYLIADNSLAENSSWDDKILQAQIKRLASVDFDLGVLGMDLSDLDLGDAFDPNLAPKAGQNLVDDDAVAGAKGKLEQVGSTPAKKTYEVVCPSCGEAFEVEL